jgi:hypothetical protein
LPFFHQIFKILILFILYFKNYKRYMLSVNWKQLLPKTRNFTICSIFSNSGHVCWPNGTKWRNL